MTNRANAFRAEHAIRDGDLVKLKLEHKFQLQCSTARGSISRPTT